MTSKTIYHDEYRWLVGQLREHRITSGLTQEALSKALGWHQQTLSEVEAAARRLDVFEYHRVTTAMGMSRQESLQLLAESWERTARHTP